MSTKQIFLSATIQLPSDALAAHALCANLLPVVQSFSDQLSQIAGTEVPVTSKERALHGPRKNRKSDSTTEDESE